MVRVLIDNANTYAGKALAEEFSGLGELAVTYEPSLPPLEMEGVAVIDV